ncbi:MAG: hypothetical protein NDP13_00535 [Crenarchaeota archaeon]|nr:hypothetical protein [Thermoproteota archaeon]MCR8453471.1 hypothetical protein [Thermoproteota archaeon]MCR8454884.1 hypothetical protein [Thermoproteota archaeon]MCR8462770.1 hypothetical protein [Thermoproteota archaeon]MCR8470535.1 hypothetical protein [Thermoproteota archaeon]
MITPIEGRSTIRKNPIGRICITIRSSMINDAINVTINKADAVRINNHASRNSLLYLLNHLKVMMKIA